MVKEKIDVEIDRTMYDKIDSHKPKFIAKPGINFFSTVVTMKPNPIGCACHARNYSGFNRGNQGS